MLQLGALSKSENFTVITFYNNNNDLVTWEYKQNHKNNKSSNISSKINKSNDSNSNQSNSFKGNEHKRNTF